MIADDGPVGEPQLAHVDADCLGTGAALPAMGWAKSCECGPDRSIGGRGGPRRGPDTFAEGRDAGAPDGAVPFTRPASELRTLVPVPLPRLAESAGDGLEGPAGSSPLPELVEGVVGGASSLLFPRSRKPEYHIQSA